MRFDKGLGAVGVLALFVMLAVLLSASLPVIKSEAPLKASDWLGFAGNIIAAVFAAAAAAVAWVVAQRQIRHAATQNSVIAYTSLREVLGAMNEDAITVLSLIIDTSMIEDEAKSIAELGQVGMKQIRMSIDLIQRHLKKLDDHQAALENARSKPWGGQNARDAREKLLSIMLTYKALANIRFALIVDVQNGKLVDGKEIGQALEPGQLLRSAEKFRDIVKREMESVNALIDEHFANFTSRVDGKLN